MPLLRVISSRLRGLFLKTRRDRELDEELKFHLEAQIEVYLRRGMSPEAARHAALLDFGGIEKTKETYRERRGIPFIESLIGDLRHSCRLMAKNPGFTAVVVLTLALGIGANTVIFSLFNALMLRSLPVENPENLVSLYRTGGWGRAISSYPLYLELRERQDLFTDVLARSGVWKVRFSAAQSDRTEFVNRELVSGNYFELLGVVAELGRLFTDNDNLTPQAHPVAVLSFDFWRSRFGSDPGILDRVLLIDDQPLRVVGVAQPGFRGVDIGSYADVWVPTMMYRGRIMDARSHWVWLLARRPPERSFSQIQAAVDTIMRQHLMEIYGDKPESPWRSRAMEQKIQVRPAGIGVSLLRDQFGKPLVVLMAAVGIVLLVACANVANLLLARGAARYREMALRFSLGATRRRLIRQWLTESLLFAVLGSLAGFGLAVWGVDYVLLFLPVSSGDFSLVVAPDRTVLFFNTIILLLSTLLFGLAPAFRSTAMDPAPALKEHAPQRVGRGSRLGLRKALVIVQVALSVVLVILAGLFARSLVGLRSLDPGFDNQSVITFSLDYPRSWEEERKAAFRQRLRDRIVEMPDVMATSYGFPGPYQGGFWNTSIRVPGSERTLEKPAYVSVHGVAPGFFETIGSLPIRGRRFDTRDSRSARKVALVNESFMREFYPQDVNTLGRVLSFDDAKPEGGEPTFIVGIVRDMLHQGLRESTRPTVYLPILQVPQDGSVREITWLVRAQAESSSLFSTLRTVTTKLDPSVAITGLYTLRQRIDDSIFLERMVTVLSGFFGGLALLLAAIGLYGVMAYGVSRRTAEFGVRMALGAAASEIRRMVLREAAILLSIGIAIGLPLSLAVGRISSSLLYGIKSNDPLTLGTTAALLFGVGLVAAFFPARRAGAIGPMQALRHE